MGKARATGANTSTGRKNPIQQAAPKRKKRKEQQQREQQQEQRGEQRGEQRDCATLFVIPVQDANGRRPPLTLEKQTTLARAAYSFAMAYVKDYISDSAHLQILQDVDEKQSLITGEAARRQSPNSSHRRFCKAIDLAIVQGTYGLVDKYMESRGHKDAYYSVLQELATAGNFFPQFKFYPDLHNGVQVGEQLKSVVMAGKLPVC